jgi:hypothetical protein
MEIRINGIAGTTPLYLNNFTFTPNAPAQGAAISEWQSYTPTITALAAGQPSSIAFKYRRVGGMMEIIGSWTNGTPTGSLISVSIPAGFTLDTTVIGTNLYNRLGEWGRANAAANNPKLGTIIANTTTSTTLVYFGLGDYTPAFSPLVPQAGSTLVAGAEAMVLRASVPISEWAGNGTVNLSTGAQIEYAWNSSTTDAADTTSFGYGPSGVQFGNFTVARDKRVQFQYPIQTGDVITLQTSFDAGVTWGDITGFNQTSVESYEIQNTATYGAQWVQGTSAYITVQFGGYRYSSGATYGAAGSAWSGVSLNASFLWRVKKSTSSSPVGFGLAGTDGSSGLYMAGRAPGLTTGAAIASGYIGELLRATAGGTVAPGASGSAKTVATITLTPGVWDVSGGVSLTTGTMTGNTYIQCYLTSTNNGNTNTGVDQSTVVAPSAVGVTASTVGPFRFNVSVSTPIYITGEINYSAVGTGVFGTNSVIRANRIA